VTTGIAGDNVHTYDFGFVNSCTESSLSPAALSIDGGAFALQQTARQSLAYLNAQAKKIGGCSGLTTAKTIQQRARADAAYQALWTDLWGLGTTQYTCANLPSLCTQTDISSEIAALRSQALRIYNVIYRNLRGSCLRRKREARMFLKRAKELRNEIYGELAQYPTTRTECTF
jgi:hypothetical protein